MLKKLVSNFSQSLYLFICLFGLGLISLILVQPARAVEEFRTNYSSHYQVMADGRTRVTQTVKLTNNLANVYAKKYSFAVGSTQISHLSASSDQGEVKISSNQLANQTEIILDFSQPVTGKDKSIEFKFSFESQDFAIKSGQVWEINLPKLNNAGQFESYQIQLDIPISFGEPALVSPQPNRSQVGAEQTSYWFTGQAIKDAGIRASFGLSQLFSFSLNYHLNNDNNYPVKTQVALPPDTNFQRVYYQSLEPAPRQVEVDVDGNWLAEYRLEAEQQLEITAVGSATIFLEPQTQPKLIEPEPRIYLQAQEYWPVNDSTIRTKAKELKDVKTIYDFVVNHLIYDYGRVKTNPDRLGALNALEQPQSAICMEFTDLFVTLARAAGIPARAVNGYAYTHNPQLKPLALDQDLLHAWPEYYDQEAQLWRPVDPTWEKTTGGVDFFNQFDLNHLVFSRQGESSIYPLPAGAYKLTLDGQRDVEVNFGQPVKPITKLDSWLKLDPFNLPWQSLNGQMTVINWGNQAIYNLEVKTSSPELNLKPVEVKVLPPYGQADLWFSLKAKAGLKSKPIQLSWQVNGQVFGQEIILPSLITPLALPYILVLSFPTVLVLLLFTLMLKIVKNRRNEKVA